MSDMISRQFEEIIVEHPEITDKEHKGKPYYSIKYVEDGEKYIGYGTYKIEVLSKYIRDYFIPSAESERKKGEWIPVSEGPPEESCRTLVTTVWGTNDRSTEYSYYFTDIEWGNLTDNVIAWMPLPEPYEEKKQ